MYLIMNSTYLIYTQSFLSTLHQVPRKCQDQKVVNSSRQCNRCIDTVGHNSATAALKTQYEKSAMHLQ